MIDNHIRSLLVDFRPDDAWLASDLPRDPDDRGSGPHSNRFLNLRHFGTPGDESDPYMPDGTFLDHVFMERDPRGIATGPDMRKHMEQQYERASFIKFYKDDDFSVPESGINPTKMVENVKAGMYQFKDRYKNFDESQDSWHNGGIGQSGRPWGVTTDNFATDGVIKDLVDAPQGNRRDAVSQLSSDPTIAFRESVPDHRFRIAHYGLVRANQDKNYQNWNNNRGSSFLDHANMAIINGEHVNRMLANLIVDLEGQRSTKQEVAQGAAFNDSAVNQQANKKLHAADIYKIMRIGGIVSNSSSAHEAFDGKRITKYNNKPLNNNRKLAANVMVNHEVANSMQQATKQIAKTTPEGLAGLRDSVEVTIIDGGIYREAGNRRINDKSLTSNQTRNIIQANHIEDQKETMNYSGIKPVLQRKIHDKSEYEVFGSHSYNTVDRKGRRKGHALKDAEGFSGEQDVGRLDFGVFDKAFKADPNEQLGRNWQHNIDNSGLEDSEQVREIVSHAFNLVPSH
jgi:hypothetical protein